MKDHLNRITILFAAYSFAALVLSVTPDLAAEIVNVQKQFHSNSDARLVLYNGDRAVWDTKIQDPHTISLSIKGDGSFILSNEENNEVLSPELNLKVYRGKMVRLDGKNSQGTSVWLVGADNKRRMIHNQETYQCLKGIGLEPIPVSRKVLEQLPNIENARAICGTNRLEPNEALQRGSYLEAGEYKLILNDRDLVHTKNGNQIWSTGIGAAQLILQTDGNLVAYDSEYKAVWASRTDGRTAGLLILGLDGSLRLYDAKLKQVWEP